jgi:hypothetical protein
VEGPASQLPPAPASWAEEQAKEAGLHRMLAATKDDQVLSGAHLPRSAAECELWSVGMESLEVWHI